VVRLLALIQTPALKVVHLLSQQLRLLAVALVVLKMLLLAGAAVLVAEAAPPGLVDLAILQALLHRKETMVEMAQQMEQLTLLAAAAVALLR
jgi:hypothetical protein